jgi:LysM repeat protein
MASARLHRRPLLTLLSPLALAWVMAAPVVAATVTVRPGDTLETIARREGVDLTTLQRLNPGVVPERLAVGTVLQLPPQGPSVVVRSGDTLEQIAQARGVSIAALLQRNPGLQPDRLAVGTVLRLPAGAVAPSPSTPRSTATAAPASDGGNQAASAALLLNAAERRDRAQQQLVDPAGWRWYGGTAVNWNGWKLHPGGVRVTVIKPNAAELGRERSLATAVAVQCETLRQTWRIDGEWQPWLPPSGGVATRIVLDLCSNTSDAPAVPVPATVTTPSAP